MAGAGHISFKATATKTTLCKLRRTGAVVETDSDLESMLSAKAQYKAALKIQSRLQGKEDISQEEKSKLAWAEQKVEEGHLHYAQLPQMKATKGEFANRVEEMMATKRQRSIESAKDTAAGKRQRGPNVVIPQPTTKKPKQKAKLSDMFTRHLFVALIDRSEENGKITAAQWKQVHAQLVESLFARMEDALHAPMPTFDGAGWLNIVNILKSNDDPTKKWQVQVVPKLEALWEGPSWR
ncbi:uncharacterized protein LOC121405018 [Drosophila obscura]|uniref:uncharacterized protein LOC121405018 n=1 Tax=Drosophila obscura TaxID=7282 RepID=UPI001BB1A7C6|nr:uncharacterized protein LOC121405018 [Drosophila obscura]